MMSDRFFTNVPLKERIDTTMYRLYQSDAVSPPVLPENILRSLLELCVKDSLFVFNGRVYYQKDGVAMGNSLGPILANIFVSHLEETLIFSSDHVPSFYRRNVDDTFCLLERKEDAHMFLINNLHTNIKCDMESAKKLEFLDVVIEKEELFSPKSSTKIKKTDKGLSYHFSSFIPDIYKKNKVFILVYRAYCIT